MKISDEMREQIVAASIEAQKCTCQLFYNLKKIGSGFFIQIEDNYFLLSAAHVLEQAYIGNMKFPNGEELVPIKGKLLITIPPDGLNRSADKIDFSVIILDDATVEEVKKKFHFLSFEHIEIDHELQDAPQYMLFGYPNQWTQVIAKEEHKVRSRIQPIKLH